MQSAEINPIHNKSAWSTDWQKVVNVLYNDIHEIS